MALSRQHQLLGLLALFLFLAITGGLIKAAHGADEQIIQVDPNDGSLRFMPVDGSLTSGQCICADTTTTMKMTTQAGALPTSTPAPTATPIPDELPSCNLDSLYRNGTGAAADPQCTNANATITSGGVLALAGLADLAADLEVEGEVSIGFTGNPAAGMLHIQGPDADLANGPHIELHVDSVSAGPVLQVYGEDDGSAVLFGAERTKAIAGFGDLSTDSTANFSIRKSGELLLFLSDNGITAGGNLIWDLPLTIDATPGAVRVGSPNATDNAGIKRILSDSITWDPPNITNSGCTDDAGGVITVTGAADGDPCFLGVTDNTADTARLQFTCYVSAANTVQIRICNVGTSGSDPPSGTFTVVVWDLV